MEETETSFKSDVHQEDLRLQSEVQKVLLREVLGDSEGAVEESLREVQEQSKARLREIFKRHKWGES